MGFLNAALFAGLVTFSAVLRAAGFDGTRNDNVRT